MIKFLVDEKFISQNVNPFWKCTPFSRREHEAVCSGATENIQLFSMRQSPCESSLPSVLCCTMHTYRPSTTYHPWAIWNVIRHRRVSVCSVGSFDCCSCTEKNCFSLINHYQNVCAPRIAHVVDVECNLLSNKQTKNRMKTMKNEAEIQIPSSKLTSVVCNCKRSRNVCNTNSCDEINWSRREMEKA